jgi:hypothetical protein
MPLHVEIYRNELPVQLRWGWWHLRCIQDALDEEGKKLNDAPILLEKEHVFIDESDGEIFPLHPGDRIEAYR